ncbi:hypothetical protein [Lentzea sp. NPDC004782]|uniref:hypothetical protein n=1 Tax=Lentzea sp. NPDC004782 TaxID=3154458 RepID=UPI0033B4A7D2
MALVTPNAAQASARWYHEHLFWNTTVIDQSVVLPLGNGLVAFSVPADYLGRVHRHLQRSGLRMPQTVIDECEAPAVILAESDGAVIGQCQMPDGVRYLMVPAVIELPLLPFSAERKKRWLSAPDPHRRWLLSATCVLAALTTATHSYQGTPGHRTETAQPRTLVG